MTLEAIKDAVAHLSGEERKQFADWFDELEEEAWDRELERDFTPGGRGARLLDEVDAEIAAGRTRPLDEVLAEVKSARSKRQD